MHGNDESCYDILALAMRTDQLTVDGEDELRLRPLFALYQEGIEAVLISEEESLESLSSDSLPQVVLLDTTQMSDSEIKRCVRKCATLKLLTIALAAPGQVAGLDVTLGFDDFVVAPPSLAELVARAKHVIWRTKSSSDDEVIRVGELMVNLTGYEVTLKGRRIDLRFKEYELLRLLATNPGRVYSREELLSQIWGYDYFGGTRTVDVHIRRLRSKIEDADHSFVETIWNVGYRFVNLESSG